MFGYTLNMLRDKKLEVKEAIEKCKELGVSSFILATELRVLCRDLADLELIVNALEEARSKRKAFK